MSTAFKPVRIGSWDLPQSFVMAPMTRSRAGDGHAPTALNAEYYAQRAGAGLVITEGVAPSPVGQGYPTVPGLYTDEQIDGWRLVADRVHAEGGTIVAQLMHVGRVAHHTNKHGAETVAPSSIQAPGQIFTLTGLVDHDAPREVSTGEIEGLIQDYVTAARNAITAGLHGVEIHGANGYLIHQFLDPSVNVREDQYGGTPANRARFAVEVVTAVAEAIGADRVGLRLSPGNPLNGMGEQPGDDLVETYRTVVDGVAGLGLAYLSVLAAALEPLQPLLTDLRAQFGGSFILNAPAEAPTSLTGVEDLLDQGLADAVAVGRSYLANPDLAERWRTGASLNDADPSTFYTGGAAGYTDYPTVEQTA